jgi:hypothetical protein
MGVLADPFPVVLSNPVFETISKRMQDTPFKIHGFLMVDIPQGNTLACLLRPHAGL